MRYERKIPLYNYKISEIESIIKLHPACFKEAFCERRVNSVYFDDLNKSSLLGNLYGESSRVKMRVRWYGDIFGKILPVLELKIKQGSAGTKRFFPLNEMNIGDYLSLDEIEGTIRKSDLSEEVLEQITMRKPVLFITYKRKYYISFDKKFRLTTDTGIQYSDLEYSTNISRLHKDEHDVIEIKYSVSDEYYAKNVITEFPFRLDKNSKYVNGILSTVL